MAGPEGASPYVRGKVDYFEALMEALALREGVGPDGAGLDGLHNGELWERFGEISRANGVEPTYQEYTAFCHRVFRVQELETDEQELVQQFSDEFMTKYYEIVGKDLKGLRSKTQVARVEAAVKRDRARVEYALKLARDNARIKKRIEAAGAQGRDSKQLEGEVKQMIKARVKERELCRARFVQKVDRENRRLVKVLRETPTKVRPKLARDQEKERRMKLNNWI